MRDSLRSIEADSTVFKPTAWARDTVPQHRYSHCFVPRKKGGKFQMIVYKEFSSLVTDLGISAKTLYSVSHRTSHHYRPVSIPKGNGEHRQLYVPDKLLMTIQRRINDKLLALEEISPYAKAYKPGGSTKINAGPHVGKPILLKLDIRHFFDHLYYPLVKEKAFPAERYSEQNRILLALLCVYKDALPQGAPTSPAISNIIMRDFDNTIGSWCAQNKIAYTRYCDDMTFSGDFDPNPVIAMVRAELKKLGLFINTKKTVIVRKGQKQIVTGIVVNEKKSVPSDYKAKLRQEMYYCMKFGIASHMERSGIPDDPYRYTLKLLGKVNYVLSVEPDNKAMSEYKSWLRNQIKQLKVCKTAFYLPIVST